jgi:uncharacterized membrane protein YkoI
MKTNSKATVAIAGVALVVGAGVALAFDDVAATGPIELSTVASDDSSEGTDADTSQDATGSSIDEAEARRLAVEQVGDGEVVHIRAERDDGRDEWEVLVRDGQDALVEVTLDAADGRVLEVDVEDDDDDRGSISTTVPEDEARRVALEATGGGEVLRARADMDDGRAEWELDIVDADGRLVEVTLDAADGRVLEVDVED